MQWSDQHRKQTEHGGFYISQASIKNDNGVECIWCKHETRLKQCKWY